MQLAPAQGLAAEELTYVMARQSTWEEESIFIDRETNMSQMFYRLALTVVTMSGADRTYTRLGGLGGMETVQLDENALIEMLRDLKALKTASRLKPGKYHVEFWDTYKGEIISKLDLETAKEKGTLTIQLPTVRRDIAIKIKPAN